MAQVNLGHVVGPGVPTGGTAGQVLKKNGSTNFDASWATLNSGNIPVSASDSTTVQQSLAAIKSDMGIVEDGNTATHTIAAGQYVIWKGALYTASAAIPAGTTLSTSNLTPVSGGGLNALNGKFQNYALKSDSGHGTTVSLDSYTSSDYTFQSDGYVIATCESSATSKAIVQIKDKNGNNFVKLGGWGNSTYASYTCYVKEGMKARVVTLENSGHINFEPFV